METVDQLYDTMIQAWKRWSIAMKQESKNDIGLRIWTGVDRTHTKAMEDPSISLHFSFAPQMKMLVVGMHNRPKTKTKPSTSSSNFQTEIEVLRNLTLNSDCPGEELNPLLEELSLHHKHIFLWFLSNFGEKKLFIFPRCTEIISKTVYTGTDRGSQL